MAVDNLAKKVTVNYDGGSITATRGLLESMFGADFSGLSTDGEQVTVSVQGHTRRRVIGGPGTSIAATTYTRTKYPVGSSSTAAGGEAILVDFGGGKWTVRLSGSHQDFCAFLLANSGPLQGNLFWQSEKGTKYGPFPG